MKHTIDDVKTVNPEFRFAESQQMERRRQAMYDTRTLFDVNETKEDEK